MLCPRDVKMSTIKHEFNGAANQTFKKFPYNTALNFTKNNSRPL